MLSKTSWTIWNLQFDDPPKLETFNKETRKKLNFVMYHISLFLPFFRSLIIKKAWLTSMKVTFWLWQKRFLSKINQNSLWAISWDLINVKYFGSPNRFQNSTNSDHRVPVYCDSNSTDFLIDGMLTCCLLTCPNIDHSSGISETR